MSARASLFDFFNSLTIRICRSAIEIGRWTTHESDETAKNATAGDMKRLKAKNSDVLR